MRTRILAAALSLGISGCAGGMSITATTPELVFIEPGIQVVVDANEPIFYTDNYYWRYSGNVWYRSQVASGGWVRFEAPPQHLRRIERPQQYAHYRPSRRAPTPVVVREDRQGPPDRERQDRDDRGNDKDKDKGDKDKDNKDKDKDKDKHRKGPH